jgi:hypothetical protein
MPHDYATMATDQKKKEKEEFFENLSHLDQLIDDVGETSDFSFKKPHPASPQPVLVTESSTVTPDAVLVPLAHNRTSEVQRKRTVAEKKSLSMPSLKPVDTEPEPIRPFSSPLPASNKHRPERLKRSKSQLDNPDPLWRKGDPLLKPVAEDRLVFEGFIFCLTKEKVILI